MSERVDCCAAAPVPNDPGAADLTVLTGVGGKACQCFPANTVCPRAARCGQGHPGYLRLLDEIRELHKTKSGGYGNGSDPMANFTAVAAATGQPRYLYPVHRTIEKLTRFLSLHEQGRVGELEEELLDGSSALLCAAAMLREDSASLSF